MKGITEVEGRKVSVKGEQRTANRVLLPTDAVHNRRSSGGRSNFSNYRPLQ